MLQVGLATAVGLLGLKWKRSLSDKGQIQAKVRNIQHPKGSLS